MSQNIILTTLGNRNMRYLNQGYPEDFIPKNVFYDKTKFLWENQSEFKNIEPTILPAILDKFPDCKLIMFTSLQDPPYQDTYYEGYILKALFKKQYPLMDVEVRNFENINPTNEDDLVEKFNFELQSLKHLYPKSNFIVYNTGGTHQQKNALKAIVEFYFEPKTDKNFGKTGTYQLYQGNEKGEETQIEEIKKTAVERINILSDIKTLILNNNYGAALTLNQNLLRRNAKLILEYTKLRWDGMWSEIDRKYGLDKFNKKIKDQNLFHVIQDAGLSSENDNSRNLFRLYQRHYRICKTLLSKTYNLAQKKEFSRAVLSFHQFIEWIARAFIEANSEFEIATNYYKYKDPLFEDCMKNHEYLFNIFDESPKYLSLPVILLYGEKLADEIGNLQTKNLLKRLMITQSTFRNKQFQKNYLDSLRNGIAHDGKGVTEKEFDVYQPLIEICYREFFQKENDLFKDLNDFIISNI